MFFVYDLYLYCEKLYHTSYMSEAGAVGRCGSVVLDTAIDLLASSSSSKC